MKQLGFTVNINNNSNILIGHSESDWSVLRDGDLVIIDTNKSFYTIGNTEKVFFIQPFKKLNNNQISINGTWEHFFLPDDILNITYKEYELLTIKQIINPGKNYKIGDIVSLSGGILSINSFDNSTQASLFKVENINSEGGITQLSILNRGCYISFPDHINDIKGGNGMGATIFIEEKLIESRKTLERQVESVKEWGADTIITLNYHLPESIIDGKVSVQKWKLYLTSNYSGETKRDVSYQIIRDLTPVLKLPFVVKNSNKLEEAYNYSIKRLDQEITNLTQQIEEIKKILKL